VKGDQVWRQEEAGKHDDGGRGSTKKDFGKSDHRIVIEAPTIPRTVDGGGRVIVVRAEEVGDRDLEKEEETRRQENAGMNETHQRGRQCYD